MSYLFAPPPQTALPVAGRTALFPVRRVYCIGRNYADHAIEMGHDPDREPPFFFQKNPDNLTAGDSFPYPPKSSDVHYEIELAVALKSGGRDLSEASALDCVFGYAVALDMTRRDLQGEAKKTGRPWEIGKAFEHSAPITPLTPASQCGHSGKRCDHAGGEWHHPSERRSQPDDLEDPPDHLLSVGLFRTRRR